MNKLVIRINHQEVVSFLLTLLTVWMSRTVFFGIVNQRVTWIAYGGCIFIAMFLVRITVMRFKRIMAKMMVPLALFLVNILVYFGEMDSSNLNAVVGYMIMTLCGAMTAILVEPQLFAKYYIRIIAVYCLISLPCILIANTNESLAYMLCQGGYDWKTQYGYSPFYTWGMNGTISLRNSGPFWEPGAFQGYIWIAALLLIFNVDEERIKHRKFVFALLIITLLTTQSTTGYVLLVLAVVLFNKRILQLLEIKSMNTKITVIILLFLFGLVLLSTSSVISNKIGDQNNVSTQMRTADVLSGGLLVLGAGPFGLGETASRNSLRTLMGLYKDDSAGLMQITYTFGWLMGIFYLVSLCGMGKRLFNADARNERIGISILMIILHLTEGLWSLPLFWVLLFELCERNKT